MQLTYRGSAYTPNHNKIEMTDTGFKGTYRGATYPIQRAISLPLQRKRNLTYRGVRYARGSEDLASVEIVVSPEFLKIY